MPSKLSKQDWDDLSERYNNPAFIPNDPISFPHRYLQSPDWRDAEMVAFLAALFSYGRREKILETLTQLFQPFGEQPVSSLLQASPKDLKKQFNGFYYRFNTETDLLFLLQRLSEVYQTYGSLKALWTDVYTNTQCLKTSIHEFRQVILEGGTIASPSTYGLKFLLADPLQNSAAKRFNMFLRWMIRHDSVDLGLWKDITPPSELIIPLDTHVATMAREFKITRRKSNDWKTAEEITQYFRRFCPEDPAKYDFALFGLGISKSQRPIPVSKT